ncbi:hypothetical protein OO185_04100 [Prosthecochloris sp. SCSIO W1102]|uniref:hypothetical protein n=1 Tax=Prosthecochloris sp. SCSIO W1102 TaxID=2992243 RepID=UPI00223CE302|nr:hypothetical protein [Prosthecochloris sp. SCSIO W1102]UZJ39122.1 hypothetical protein OO185_04100 [Prosthecochloris sp. SCSIO W1102]
MQDFITLNIDNHNYSISISQKTANDADSIKILIPVYMLSKQGYEIFRVCIESLKRNTQENHEIWIIDNNSPTKYSKKLSKIKNINIITNKTEPINKRIITKRKKKRTFNINFFLKGKKKKSQLSDGSYANAIALEIGSRIINQKTRYVLAMHSDILVTRKKWLTYLKSKLSNEVRAVGCFKDNIRINALHISGLLFDFQLFKSLEVDFLPNIKQRLSKERPEYDVGDLISLRFLQNNYKLFCCKNTHNNPNLLPKTSESSIFNLNTDRSFDDNDNIIFMHLGRGTPKSINKYKKNNKTTARQWIKFADKIKKI